MIPKPAVLVFLETANEACCFPFFLFLSTKEDQARENASIKPNEGFPLRLLIRGAGGGNNEAFTIRKKKKKVFLFGSNMNLAK